MNPMHLMTYTSLMLTLIVILIPEICSYPVYYDDVDRIVQSPIDSIDRLDDDYYITYPRERRQHVRRSDTSNLRNGYYYVDNGSITPVRPSGQRRQDFDLNNSIDANNLPSNVKFTPLVRFKQTQTHRKKLFVPNFFG